MMVTGFGVVCPSRAPKLLASPSSAKRLTVLKRRLQLLDSYLQFIFNCKIWNKKAHHSILQIIRNCDME